MPKFYFTSEERIKSGELSDVYFPRAKEVLLEKGLAEKRVVADIHSYSLPKDHQWAVLAGIEEVAHLLRGHNINVDAMREGTIFRLYEPVLSVEGAYTEFGVFEPSLLGLLRHSSSIATRAARCKKVVGDKTIVFFGIRAVHPLITPMVDRAAFIGGCDAVSGTIGAEMIGEEPVGTMPHALILVFEDQVKAWKTFDEVMSPEVPRIALCDTFYDEKIEALMAARALGERLYGVRLDTPGSRKGDFREIAEETRWTLDIHGFKHVKIFMSGGLNEYNLGELREVADGFGVGTSIAFPPPVNMAMDIVELEGRPYSKKGKLSGKKQVYRCKECFGDKMVPTKVAVDRCPRCGGEVEPLLKPLIREGEIVSDLPSARDIRDYVLQQLERVELRL
ncbi:MAG: nicotinate phosphoribosyltransferase [Candidatus Geothermarchaeales archaeon]